MGDQAEDILLSFRLTNEEAKRCTIVVGKFEQYFVKCRNVIYKCSKFNQHVQESDETVDLFIIALYRLAETCNYGEPTDKMICDRIIVGIRNNLVAERLQLDPELTLEKTIQVTRQNEALKSQQGTVRAQQQEQPTTVVNVITSKQCLPPTRGSYTAIIDHQLSIG